MGAIIIEGKQSVSCGDRMERQLARYGWRGERAHSDHWIYERK